MGLSHAIAASRWQHSASDSLRHLKQCLMQCGSHPLVTRTHPEPQPLSIP